MESPVFRWGRKSSSSQELTHRPQGYRARNVSLLRQGLVADPPGGADVGGCGGGVGRSGRAPAESTRRRPLLVAPTAAGPGDDLGAGADALAWRRPGTAGCRPSTRSARARLSGTRSGSLPRCSPRSASAPPRAPGAREACALQRDAGGRRRPECDEFLGNGVELPGTVGVPRLT